MATGTIKNTVRQMRTTTRQVINASLMMDAQLPANWDISYMMKNTYRTVFYLPYMVICGLVIYNLVINKVELMGILFYLSALILIRMVSKALIPSYMVNVKRTDTKIEITWFYKNRKTIIPILLEPIDDGYYVNVEFDKIIPELESNWRLPHGLSMLNDMNVIRAFYDNKLVTKPVIDK